MRLTNNSSDIPKYLKEIPRWIIWELTGNGQKIPKRPTCDSLTNGSSTDPTCWADFNTAARAMLHHSDSRNVGLGFVLVGDDTSDSPIVGFDLDDSLKADGEIKPWAAKIMESLEPIAYTEVSPSGTGLKCFVSGDLPDGFVSKKSFGDGKEGTEVYGAGRYFAVTGDRLYDDNLSTVAPESILRAVHIPDEPLCMRSHASTAGGSSSASGPIMCQEGAPSGRRPLRTPRSFPGPTNPGETFGTAEALRKPFHVEQARVQHQHRNFTLDTRRQGQEYKY